MFHIKIIHKHKPIDNMGCLYINPFSGAVVPPSQVVANPTPFTVIAMVSIIAIVAMVATVATVATVAIIALSR